jgi:hypothetical protein
MLLAEWTGSSRHIHSAFLNSVLHEKTLNGHSLEWTTRMSKWMAHILTHFTGSTLPDKAVAPDADIRSCAP